MREPEIFLGEDYHVVSVIGDGALTGGTGF